ncbi:MAG: glycosyltransferase family 1 protein [Acidobacteriota bacterium]
MRIGIDARKIRDFGIGTYIRGLMRGLDALEGDEEYVAWVPADAVSLVPRRFTAVVENTPNYGLRELLQMRRAADRAHIDLYHSPHLVVPFVSMPFVASIHDVIPSSFPERNPIAALYIKWMTTRAVRQSLAVLTGSEAAKRAITRAFRADAEKIVVTSYGIDVPAAVPPQRSWGRYILFVGNDKPHKNVAVLVDAMAIVRRSEPTLSLVLAGGAFERFAHVDGVRRTGFISEDELGGAYRGALALVLPSLEEGFGLPAAEAMTCGVPVITSEAEALLEVTADAALHVDGRSADALAGAILRVTADEALRAELARRGDEWVRQFTWRRCAERTLAVYRDKGR